MIVTDILLPYSPVKHQASTASCWAFSLCSFWETEQAVETRASVPHVEYSPWFLARHKIHRFAEVKIRESFFPLRRLPVGAQGQTAVAIAEQCGVADIRSYAVKQRGQYKGYRTMMRIIQLLVWVGQLTIVLRKPFLCLVDKVIDRYWDKLPASDVINHDLMPSIRFFTSFTHLPVNEEVCLPLPDNFERWKFYNIKIDELIQKLKCTLLNGHSVVWQGHLGRGFSMKNGFAIIPESINVSDELRSKLFQEGKITDDHMMHIIGLAHDDDGHSYFITKNSVGDLGPYHGLVYMEENYIRLYTIAIGL